MATSPIQVLRSNRQEAVRFAQEAGAKKLRKLLRRAQLDLNARLRRAEMFGAGPDSFTATQLRATLAQIEAVTRQLKGGVKSLVLDQAGDAVDPSVEGVVRYLRDAEKKFSGVAERLPLREAAMLDRAHKGAESSVLHRLEGDPVKGPGILDRYGDAVVARFEERLQERFVAKQPWEQVRNSIIAESPFLQQAPAHWAERIVRTELMGAQNRAIWEANREADEQLGDVVKILAATFDSRTSWDSFMVHGQIRRPEEAFACVDAKGRTINYQHPPGRPNDREVVVTHRTSWPIPPELAQLPLSAAQSRWAINGGRGAMPSRPKMTTVPLEKFGRAA